MLREIRITRRELLRIQQNDIPRLPFDTIREIPKITKMRFEDENNEDNWMPSMMISIDIPTVNEYINDHPCNEQVSYPHLN